MLSLFIYNTSHALTNYTKYMDKMGEATFDMGNATASGNEKLHQPKTKAKRGRKDRHSKVCTAGGTRDRRVRLSPKTAILFFDLQDRLGCDRPSKAIDWLMTEAKPAIDALGHPNYNVAACKMIQNDLSNRGAPPPMNGREAGEHYQEQLLSTPTPLELFDANSEIVRLQKIFSWNYGEDYSSAALHYPAAAADFRPFAEREPLQSSYSSRNSPQFQGFGVSDQELPNFLKEDEMPVLSKSSSTAFRQSS